MEEERKHPIIEDCEVNDKGEIKHEFMLSLNGMYISGITRDQLDELWKEVDYALDTHEEEAKVKKYYYVTLSFMRSDKENFRVVADMTVDVENSTGLFPLMACLKAGCKYFAKEANIRTMHIDGVQEISESDFLEYRKFEKELGAPVDVMKS